MGWVAPAIFVFAVLLCLCPLTVRLTWAEGRLRFAVSAAGLILFSDRKSRKRKGPKPGEAPPGTAGKKRPVSPGDIPGLIRPALETAGKILGKCRIRRLFLRYAAGGGRDAAAGALRCGRAWAAASVLLAWIRLRFRFPLRSGRLDIGCDFEAEEDVLFFDALLTWRLGGLLAAGGRLLFLSLRRAASARRAAPSDKEAS